MSTLSSDDEEDGGWSYEAYKLVSDLVRYVREEIQSRWEGGDT